MAHNEGSHRIEPTTTDEGPTTLNDHDKHDPANQDVRAGQYSPAATQTVTEQRILPAKTSAAAVFALIFGLSAFLAVLTIILAPLALALALIGIILAIIGMRMTRRVGVTGKGVAIGGLVLAVLALILSITVVAGVTTVLNNKTAVDRINKQVTKLENNLPKKVSVPST